MLYAGIILSRVLRVFAKRLLSCSGEHNTVLFDSTLSSLFDSTPSTYIGFTVSCPLLHVSFCSLFSRLLSLSLAFCLPTRGDVFASCSRLCLLLMYSFVLVPTSLLGLSGIPTHHLLHSYAIEEAARVKEKLNSRDPTAPESEVIGLLAHC